MTWTLTVCTLPPTLHMQWRMHVTRTVSGSLMVVWHAQGQARGDVPCVGGRHVGIRLRTCTLPAFPAMVPENAIL